MILGSNVAAARREVEGGNVVRAIAVLQFYCLSAGSECEKLVPETDAHYGASVRFHELTQMVDRLLTMCRVARAVTDKYAIKVVSDLVNGVVPWEAGDARTTGDERAEDVLLHATINYGDVAVTVAGGDVERSLGGYLLNQIDLLGVYKSFVLVCIILLSNSDTGKGGTLFTEIRDYSTGVNTGYRWNALARTPRAEGFDGGPVRVALSRVSNNDTDGLQMWRFKVFEETIRVTCIRGDAVVTDEGLCEDEDLATVGGVTEGFRVANESGGENGFPRDVGACAEGFSVEDRSILEDVSMRS